MNIAPHNDTPVEPEVDDTGLLLRVRAGDLTAYSELYDAYHGPARRYANRLASQTVSADDLVAEAFTRTLAAIQRGRGPVDGFRPYLFTALRRIASRSRMRDGSYPTGLDPFEANPQLASPSPADVPTGDEVVIPALSHLPQRWQQVLWMLEVEGRSVTEAADALGLTPNATSALAYRARRGLRVAYLQVAEGAA